MSAKLYIGNLDINTNKEDLTDEFRRFGKITDIQVWNYKNPTAFAFIEYEDDRWDLRNTGPWLADNQSRDPYNYFWLVVRPQLPLRLLNMRWDPLYN